MGLKGLLRGLLIVFLAVSDGLKLYKGAYEDLVVEVSEDVSNENCQTVISNLEKTLMDSSEFIFSALDGRAYFRSVIILVPGSWPDACLNKPSVPGSGEQPDVSVVVNTPTSARIWTQQSVAVCGAPGDQMYFSANSLQAEDSTLARTFVKEFAKYRYGVFDESGYNQDPVYPMCYKDEDETHSPKITGCSDLPLQDDGLCTDPNSNSRYNISNVVNPKARSSIMFAAEAPSVSMFCDEGTHDRVAPTKHNFICERRSTLDVILQHQDFLAMDLEVQHTNKITNTTPAFTYKKRTMTRYVLVIEDTQEMQVRESWTYLRNAIRKWALYDLPSNTEIGLVTANETAATIPLQITSLSSSAARNLVASNIPYTPGDSRAAACLQCAINDAVRMLKAKTDTDGPASSVLVLIAPGTEHGQRTDELVLEAKESNIRIVTINYPGIVRQRPLDTLAERTGGVAYTVREKKHNIGTSLLTTYFQLTNVMYNIAERYYEGNPSSIPIEIHRRELTDDGRNMVRGSFVLDENLGEPVRFALFTHDVDSPLVKSLTLVSPSHVHYHARSDNLVSVKILTLAVTFNETGTWEYKIERYPGNPQPHFVQVTATPRTLSADVVRAHFWIRRGRAGSPLTLYAEVKRRGLPVIDAKVEVAVSRPEHNGSTINVDRFQLLDTGGGDPDILKADGIYSRYFSTANAGGPDAYTFEVIVTNNGETAYTRDKTSDTGDTKCCGSFVPKSQLQLVPTFERVLPPVTIFVSQEDMNVPVVVGRIGDLRAQVLTEEQKVKLTWTAPDMGGTNVVRYEVRYGTSLSDITDKFEMNALPWEHESPFPQAAGSDTTFTMNFKYEPALLDRPLYLAVRGYSRDGRPALPSNWVRVFMPRPPPPTIATATPIYPTIGVGTSWPNSIHKSVDVQDVRSHSSHGLGLGLQLILPIVFGVILLTLVSALYCYCCVMRRKRTGHSKEDKMSTVTIVPGGTGGCAQINDIIPNTPQHNTAYATDTSDHHTVGVPVYQEQYEDDEPTKKRLSIVHQQEQQLIEELKQQQHQQQYHYQQQQQLQIEQTHTPNNGYGTTGGTLSVISNNSLQRGGRTLSPYESWTASQLLHEHERRHSPSIGDDIMQQHVDHQQHQQLLQPDHISVTGQSLDHVSLSGGLRTGPADHYNMVLPPPVPPLPTYNGYPVNYNIYGVQQHRTDGLAPYGSSLQGSVNSVSSGDKKRRNVTMV